MQLRHFQRYILSFFLLLASAVSPAHAASVSELRDSISDRNRKIEELEKEIRQYENQLVEVGKEKQTLESAIKELDLSRKKISTDITLTQNKIGATDLVINQLALEIGDKSTLIEQNRSAIAESLRTLNEIESDSMIELLLSREDFSDVWDQVSTIGRFQLALKDDITELSTLKTDLEGKKSESEAQKDKLAVLRSELSGQKQVLDQNRQAKNQLLASTKNQEASYQQQLAAKVAAREQFERELEEFESQLEYALDPSKIPPTGQGVLAWPLKSLYVTQYFGNTPFAKSGAYNGNGHNGMDFRASVGTTVYSSLSGIVLGTGNTDAVKGCYSYGKWILVKHNNGLSTLYAHLSSIKVGQGQNVATGEIIGYSGNTGYTTGPHLHYGVYLSDAVKVIKLSDFTSRVSACASATIPVSPREGYMNPLDYLTDANKFR